MTLPENFEGSFELNQSTLCLCGLSKGYNTGITEYINLKNRGNDKGDDQKANICMLSIQLSPLLLPYYSIFSIKEKFEQNQKTLCECTFSIRVRIIEYCFYY